MNNKLEANRERIAKESNPDKRSCVYAIAVHHIDTDELFIKIGVTINIRSRFSGVRSATKDNYRTTILGAVVKDNTRISLENESCILNELTSHSPKHKFTGYTECVSCSEDNLKYLSAFLNIPYESVLNIIETLRQDIVFQNTESNVLCDIDIALSHGVVVDGFYRKTYQPDLMFDVNDKVDDDMEYVISGNVALFNKFDTLVAYNIEDIFTDDGEWYVMINSNDMVCEFKEYDINDECKLGASLWHYKLCWDNDRKKYIKEKMFIVNSYYLHAINKVSNKHVIPDGIFSCSENMLKDYIR